MQTLKLSVSLPDDTHPDMELRLTASEAACDVVIALPVQPNRQTRVRRPVREAMAPRDESDDYVLGGYAGI
jgi:hypothetical protein